MSITKSATVASKSIVASGTAAANLLEVNCSGKSFVTFDLTGTWVATVLFEAQIDGTNWSGISAKAGNGVADATRVISAAANGMFFVEAENVKSVRARCSAFTSGTIVVKAISGIRDGLRLT